MPFSAAEGEKKNIKKKVGKSIQLESRAPLPLALLLSRVMIAFAYPYSNCQSRREIYSDDYYVDWRPEIIVRHSDGVLYVSLRLNESFPGLITPSFKYEPNASNTCHQATTMDVNTPTYL